MFQWKSQAYTKKNHNERVLPLYALHTKNFTKETLQSLAKYLVWYYWTAMGTKMAVAFANIFMAKIEKEILRQSSIKPD